MKMNNRTMHNLNIVSLWTENNTHTGRLPCVWITRRRGHCTHLVPWVPSQSTGPVTRLPDNEKAGNIWFPDPLSGRSCHIPPAADTACGLLGHVRPTLESHRSVQGVSTVHVFDFTLKDTFTCIGTPTGHPALSTMTFQSH